MCSGGKDCHQGDTDTGSNPNCAVERTKKSRVSNGKTTDTVLI